MSSLRRLLSIISVAAVVPVVVTAPARAAEPDPSKLRVFCAEVALAESAKAEGASLLDAKLAAVVAQGVADLGPYEAVTFADLKEAIRQKKRDYVMGGGDVDEDLDFAKHTKAALLVRTEVGRVGEGFLVTAALIAMAETRVVRRVMLTPGSVEQVRQVLATVGRKLLQPTKEDQAAVQAPPLPDGDVLVFVQPADAALVDESGRIALERTVAKEVAAGVGRKTIAREELGDQLEAQELQRMLGEGDPEAFLKIGEATKARYLANLNLGKAGTAVVVAGSLIDTKETRVVGRASVVLPNTDQLVGAAEVVSLGLFGKDRALPPPPADETRFEKAMTRIATELRAAYLESKPGALSRLAVLPLTDRGPDAKGQDLGKECASYLTQTLSGDERIRLVDAKRMDELAGAQDLSGVADLPPKQLQQLGTFLGASDIVVGTVSGIGNDFLVQVRTISLPGGETVGGSYALFPMGEPGSLFKKAFVVRTRSGAIFRSVLVPGWGQFYNRDYGRGTVMTLGAVGAAGVAVAALVLAQKKIDEKKEWEPGTDNFVEAGCRGTEVKPCLDAQTSLQDEADQLQLYGYGAIGAYAAIWLWGVLDAAVSGEDYSEAVYGLRLEPNPNGFAVAGEWRF